MSTTAISLEEERRPGKPAESQRFTARRAAIVFWIIVPLFAVVWAVLPAVFHLGYRNDVIELILSAKEWPISTQKHPALTSWLFEIASTCTNRAFITPFIIGQAGTILTVCAVWQLARTVLTERYALVAALAALPQRLLSTESVLFNHNSILLFCYALTVYFVFRAFQTNRLRFWIASGLVIGLAFHNKYPIIFVVLAILSYMLIRPNGRKYWRTPGPYITIAIAAVVFLPHLVWLVQNDFPTLRYAGERPKLEGFHYHFLLPIKFALSQPLYWIPSLIVLLPALGIGKFWKFKAIKDEQQRECERFLFYCSIVPIVFHLMIAAMNVKLKMVYGAPFWCFFGVWVMLRFQTFDSPQLLRKTIACLIGVETVLIAGFVITFMLGKQPEPVYLPMDHLAGECQRIWDEKNYPAPCPYVSGDMILAGHAAYRMPGRPSCHYFASTWSSDETVNECGGVVLWEIGPEDETVPSWLHERYPNAEVVPEIVELRYSENSPKCFPRTKLGIAIIPPKPDSK